MASGLIEHPLRRTLANEVHARPFEVIGSPCRVSHIALLGDETLFVAEWDRLLDLCRRHGVEPPPSTSFISADLGAFRLRWERHGEFSTYTFFRFDDFDAPFADTAFDLIPRGWLGELPGQMLVALHLAVETRERDPAGLAQAFEGNQLIGSRVNGGAGAAWTDFRLHGDGFGRALILNQSLTRGQTGRLVQRLVEIETYRMMALLAFPVAREATSVLNRIESRVAGIVTEMSSADSSSDERDLLATLTALAAETERLAATTSYRFTAARAYHAIVTHRIEVLREARIPGTQTISEFMDRRLAPAMLTCRSVTERLEILSRHLARAGDLLRTRVDIALEENNRDLLLSMDRRAKVQLRLQQTVEGLSVVAISYYLLGLLGYAAKGAKALGAPVDPELAVLLGLPVVFVLVAVGVRRLRHALGGE